MSKRPYFSQYESPNIVIVPTVSFCNASTTKKMKLSADVDGISSNNGHQLDIGKVYLSKSENKCILVESTTNSNENSLRKDLLSTNSKNSIIKQSKSKHDSEPAPKVLQVIEKQDTLSVTKDANKHINLVNKHQVSESSSSCKNVLGSPKNIADNKKNKLPEHVSDKKCDAVLKQINKVSKKNERIPLKCTQNQYISSSPKIKTQNNHEDTAKRRIPSANKKKKSPHTCSKAYTNRKEQSTKVTKYDNGDQSSSFKHLHHNSKNEQKHTKTRKDKTGFLSGSENMCSNNKILEHDKKSCCNVSDPIRDYKKHNTKKHKNEVHMHTEIKNKGTSTSRNKEHVNKTDTFTAQKKRNRHKENSADNYDNKSISTENSRSRDRHKVKKVEIRQKSTKTTEENNRKHKSSKKDGNIKKSTRGKKHTDNSHSNCRKIPSNNSYENFTVTVETQGTKPETFGSLKAKKIAKSHKTKGIQLIINLVVKNADNKQILTATDNSSCSNIEDTKTPSVSNSELSFLDDINIDEIVDSLRQPKCEPDTTQELKDINRSPQVPIIIIGDDESDLEENNVCEVNKGIRSIEAPIKFEKHDITANDIKSISDDIVNTKHFNDSSMNLLKQRDQNATQLNIENVTKQEVIEKKIQITPIDLTDDDTIDALSDCSTVILGVLDQFDDEGCDENSREKEGTPALEVAESTNHQIKEEQNYNTVGNSISQSAEIALPKRTILKDPIEAQLNKMFEMCSSDTDIEKSVSVNLDHTKEMKNTAKEKPEMTVWLHQNDNKGYKKDKICEFQSNNHTNQYSITNETNHIINECDNINKNKKILENEILLIDTSSGINLNTKVIIDTSARMYPNTVVVENERITTDTNISIYPNMEVVQSNKSSVNTTASINPNTKLFEIEKNSIDTNASNPYRILVGNKTIIDTSSIDPNTKVVQSEKNTINTSVGINRSMEVVESNNATISSILSINPNTTFVESDKTTVDTSAIIKPHEKIIESENITLDTSANINPNTKIVESEKNTIDPNADINPHITVVGTHEKFVDTSVNMNSNTKVTGSDKITFDTSEIINPNKKVADTEKNTIDKREIINQNTKVADTEKITIDTSEIIYPNKKVADTEKNTIDKREIINQNTKVADTEKNTIDKSEIINPNKKVADTEKNTIDKREIINQNTKVADTEKITIDTSEIIYPNTKVADTEKNTIDKSEIINPTTKYIENKNNTIDTTSKRPTETVRSEIRKITDIKLLPLTEDHNFIQALEKRMLIYLKTQYNVTSLIHKGRHSKIYQCTDLGGFTYALKILNNTRDRNYRGIEKENMLTNIQKEIPKEKLHCVYLINGFSMSGYWCFLMEYYPKTLFKALQERDKSFHINTVQTLARQLIVAVTVLRNNNIVHSDIKPAHILINIENDRIKLCGFDTAFYVKDTPIVPNIGTSNYRAPEVILGYPSGFSLDVWSTALVMYEMATKKKLFPGFFNNDILYKQQCTLGGIPYDMLDKCIFRENHFYVRNFMRIGFKNEVIQFIHKFKRSKRLHWTIFDAYTRDWCKLRTAQQCTEDLAKLADFKMLLEQMLMMHPKHRLSIEFVYINPFIYEYSEMSNL